MVWCIELGWGEPECVVCSRQVTASNQHVNTSTLKPFKNKEVTYRTRWILFTNLGGYQTTKQKYDQEIQSSRKVPERKVAWEFMKSHSCGRNFLIVEL